MRTTPNCMGTQRVLHMMQIVPTHAARQAAKYPHRSRSDQSFTSGMSDSELSEASTGSAPSDRELEKSLRQEVTKAHRAGVEFSFNSIRAASEQKLGLKKDYIRNHETWARRSKDVINDQMVSRVFAACKTQPNLSSPPCRTMIPPQQSQKMYRANRASP